ncbi:MAG TPA: MucB/RseB C-terminal domain-containing protein [Steroidobacteraceae bacterium]
MRSGQRQTRAARSSLLPVLLRAVGGCAALWIGAEALAADAPAADTLPAPAPAGGSPRDWILRTDQALSNRNYEGVFVHEHAGESETLHVIHRADSEGAAERLQSMDGSGREFVRNGARLTCYLPDQRTVLVEKSPAAALLLSGLPRVDAGSAGQYEIKELARTRISGRDARLIAVTPLDQLRYGYRIWIDEGTAMPLKTQLRDSRGGVLEQIVFTSLKMLAHIPNAELEPAIDARAYRWLRRDAEPVDVRSVSISWQADTLPAGFRMTASTRQMLPAGPVEHLVFSDGLASVSVFIELGAGGPAPDRDDAATLGTSSAYSTVVQGHRVTAVGEVPPETVRVIAQSIRNSGPAADVAGSATGDAAMLPPAAAALSPAERARAALEAAGEASGSLIFGPAAGPSQPSARGLGMRGAFAQSGTGGLGDALAPAAPAAAPGFGGRGPRGH